MTETRYKVGQVLFVIDSNRNAVLPCRVIEELTKKTLDGDVVTYKVIFGIDPKNTMDLSTVKGEIHTSLLEVKKVLTANVTRWVDNHVQKAAKATITWYQYDALAGKPTLVKNEEPDTQEMIQSLPELNLDGATGEEMLIEVAPGQFAKAKIKGLK